MTSWGTPASRRKVATAAAQLGPRVVASFGFAALPPTARFRRVGTYICRGCQKFSPDFVKQLLTAFRLFGDWKSCLTRQLAMSCHRLSCCYHYPNSPNQLKSEPSGLS